MNNFKDFLLNENKSYIGKKINRILTDMQDIQNDIDNLGSRQLNRMSDQIVDSIRSVLHGDFEERNKKYLLELQKIGVAIKKTIEEKGDLKEIFPSIVQAMQDLAGKLGIKVNNLQAPEMPSKDVTQDDFELTK